MQIITIISDKSKMKNIKLLLILFAISGLSISTNSQIFYQDLIPDVEVVNWDVKDIHIDSVATSTLSYGGPGNLSIWAEFGMQIAVNAFSDCDVLMNGAFPAALDLNQSIDSTAIWEQPDYAILNDGSQGNWIGIPDKYLGVRIKNGSQWLYGWIRLSVNMAGPSVTIKDYACNRTPNTAITAGQIVTGINAHSNESGKLISVYPNPFNISATVRNENNFQSAILSIYNLYGQKVKEILNISGQEITIYRDNLPGGIYLISLTQNDKTIMSEKIIITD